MHLTLLALTRRHLPSTTAAQRRSLGTMNSLALGAATVALAVTQVASQGTGFYGLSGVRDINNNVSHATANALCRGCSARSAVLCVLCVLDVLDVPPRRSWTSACTRAP